MGLNEFGWLYFNYLSCLNGLWEVFPGGHDKDNPGINLSATEMALWRWLHWTSKTNINSGR